MRPAMTTTRPARLVAAIAIAAGFLAAGCQHRSGQGGVATPTAGAAQAAAAGALATGGIAILTPTAGFGQEENRQSFAKVFAELLAERRPDLRVVPLANTLSAVNAAGLGEPYERMHNGYRNTGILDRDTLRSVAGAVGARYALQLKLQAFQQGSRARFGYLGVNLLQTQTASIRIFVQIWDATDGGVVWEDSRELSRQTEAVRERPITMDAAIRAAAPELIGRLPP